MAVEPWPVVPTEQLRRGDLVYLPTAVDGDRVLRWIGPIRVGVLRRAKHDGRPYAVVHWAGGEGPLVLTGRLYSAGVKRQPATGRPL